VRALLFDSFIDYSRRQSSLLKPFHVIAIALSERNPRFPKSPSVASHSSFKYDQPQSLE
jgi:hypothetical protein